MVKKNSVLRFADNVMDVARAFIGPTPKANGAPRIQERAIGRDMPEDPAEPGSGGKRHLTAALMKEWTRAAVSIMHGTFDYNPDDLVRTKGRGIGVYQDMLRDPYVKAGLAIKKLSVCRLPVTIMPASDSARDVEIARFVEEQFETMTTPWYTLLWGVMDSVNCGYSISEINYKVIEKGDWKGKIGWDSVKSKDPYVFSYRLKENGDIKTIVQRFGASYDREESEGGRYEYDPEKFLTNAFQPLYSNPYGSSDLRAAYRAFFIKDWAWKFRAIFMEKWGSPTVVGSFPNGTSEARRHQMEEVLESIQQETTITIPEDLKIEIIRVATTGNITEYERSIADLNKEILVGLLGSFMAVEEGKRSGARAQGQVHLWVAKLFIEALVYTIQEDLNRQMIHRLVDINYADVAKYPRLQFELSRVEDLMMEADLDIKLQSMGAELSPEYLTKKYGRPIIKVNLRVDGQPDGKSAAETKPKPLARGEKIKSAGPSANPKTNMEEAFGRLRQDALPEDPKKIGDLKDTYTSVVRMIGAFSNHKFTDADKIAFDLAGDERAYHMENEAWMEPGQAYQKLMERILRR